MLYRTTVVVDMQSVVGMVMVMVMVMGILTMHDQVLQLAALLRDRPRTQHGHRLPQKDRQ